MVLLISYDLNGHERPTAYAAVKTMIEQYAPDHRKPLYSQWLVNTDDPIETWVKRMQGVTDADDAWFISRVRPDEYNGFITETIWPWLAARA